VGFFASINRVFFAWSNVDISAPSVPVVYTCHGLGSETVVYTLDKI